MLEPDWLPALLPSLLPPEEDEGIELGDGSVGIEDPEPPPPEEEDGMPERPEEPERPDDPLEPEDPPLEPGGEELGEDGIEEDC